MPGRNLEEHQGPSRQRVFGPAELAHELARPRAERKTAARQTQSSRSTLAASNRRRETSDPLLCVWKAADGDAGQRIKRVRFPHGLGARKNLGAVPRPPQAIRPRKRIFGRGTKTPRGTRGCVSPRRNAAYVKGSRGAVVYEPLDQRDF